MLAVVVFVAVVVVVFVIVIVVASIVVKVVFVLPVIVEAMPVVVVVLVRVVVGVIVVVVVIVGVIVGQPHRLGQSSAIRTPNTSKRHSSAVKDTHVAGSAFPRHRVVVVVVKVVTVDVVKVVVDVAVDVAVDVTVEAAVAVPIVAVFDTEEVTVVVAVVAVMETVEVAVVVIVVSVSVANDVPVIVAVVVIVVHRKLQRDGQYCFTRPRWLSNILSLHVSPIKNSCPQATPSGSSLQMYIPRGGVVVGMGKSGTGGCSFTATARSATNWLGPYAKALCGPELNCTSKRSAWLTILMGTTGKTKTSMYA